LSINYRQSGKVTACFLGLDSAENVKEINQNDAVRKLGLIIKAVNFPTILWDGGERKDVDVVMTT
jgi:hypothetical protein